MVYAGPQKYPGASLAYFYQDRYGGLQQEANVVVWHTTEGMTLPDYGGGASAPNLTAKPDFTNKRLNWHQHFDIDRSARALVDSAGGAATNRGNAVQVELIGTCDPATMKRWVSQGRKQNSDFIFWPEAPDWALAEVAKFVTWLHENHDVKIRSTVTWKAYPGSYGVSNPNRLTASEWGAYYGHLGHQHVPENSHGDPGNINFARIIEHALGAGAAVALSVDDVKKIFGTDGILAAGNPTTENPYWTAGSFLTETYKKAGSAEVESKKAGAAAAAAKTAIASVGKQVTALDAKVSALQTGGVDLDALAAKVADLLAARLAD